MRLLISKFDFFFQGGTQAMAGSGISVLAPFYSLGFDFFIRKNYI
jgi:hypothetical protein